MTDGPAPIPVPTPAQMVATAFDSQIELEFHDVDTFVLMNTLLSDYGFTLMPTRESVGDRTIAVLTKIGD